MFTLGIAVKYRLLIVLLVLVGYASPMQGALSDLSPTCITGPFAAIGERGSNVLWTAKPHDLAVNLIAEHRIQCWPLSEDLKSMTPSFNPYAEPEDECRYPVVTANANTQFIL